MTIASLDYSSSTRCRSQEDGLQGALGYICVVAGLVSIHQVPVKHEIVAFGFGIFSILDGLMYWLLLTSIALVLVCAVLSTMLIGGVKITWFLPTVALSLALARLVLDVSYFERGRGALPCLASLWLALTFLCVATPFFMAAPRRAQASWCAVWAVVVATVAIQCLSSPYIIRVLVGCHQATRVPSDSLEGLHLFTVVVVVAATSWTIVSYLMHYRSFRHSFMVGGASSLVASAVAAWIFVRRGNCLFVNDFVLLTGTLFCPLVWVAAALPVWARGQ